MHDDPTIAIKIMYKMLHTTTGRLQTTGAFLSDMVKWGEAARIRAVTDDFTGLYNRRFFDDAIRGCRPSVAFDQPAAHTGDGRSG